MQILTTNDSEIFFKKHTNAWLDYEAANSALMNTIRAKKTDAKYFEVSINGDSTQLTACLVPNDQILVSSGSEAAVNQLAQYIFREKIIVPGIFAVSPVSTEFAETYSKLRKIKYRCVKQLGHYELQEFKKVTQPEYVFGPPSPEDIDALVKYKVMSQKEENIQRPSLNPAEFIQKEIQSESLYVLRNHNGEIQCIGSVFDNRSQRSGYIAGIYTPKEMRGRGFATAMTYELSKRIHGKKLIPSLSVDIVNHPAIRAYEKVGFVKLCQMDNIRFS